MCIIHAKQDFACLPDQPRYPVDRSSFSAMATMMLSSAASYGPWSVVTAVVLGILLLVWFLTESSKPKNLPPGPRRLPIIGTLHLLGKYPQRDIAKLEETYGPLMSLWLGSRLAVVASSREAAEQILKIQGPNFSDRLKTSFSDIIFPNDIAMTSDSPKRLHLKKVLQTQLSTTKQLQLTENMRSKEIGHALQMIMKNGASPVRVRTYVEVATTNILSCMILKKRFLSVTSVGDKHNEPELEEVKKFKTILSEIAKYFQIIHPGDFIPIMKWINFHDFERRLQNLKGQMDAFMSTIINEHIAQRKSGSFYIKDMTDVLLDEMENDTLQLGITNADIDNTLWDGFTAGINTTTDTIEWIMAECICNPNVMKIAQAELDSVVGKSRRVKDADVPNLKYLQAIIKETFRLHPVVPLLVPHVNKNACKVLGYDIPEKTPVFVDVVTISRDPRIWKDPTVFKPERFLDGMPHADTDYKGKHYELLPFGTGRRACPGIALGSSLVHIIIASLLQSFDWSLPNDLQPVEGEGFGHLLAPPLVAIPKARLPISSMVN